MRRFAYRLAGALGLPATAVLDDMTSAELTEWMAYRQVELLPGERLEVLVATLIALTANIHRGKGEQAATAMDYLPWLREAEADEAPDQAAMLRMVEQLNAAFGGRDLRGEAA